ncbi:hypothetical protein C7212DRAFT_233209 [Tuber magnatum]|uniref:Uncharacterized protein n=1 Tax=Tuber magnatum TaxID=42249 RepID=A0A317SEX3_9PEZI|nr:hypothetical protein C7212DRAFT_233209 [Tuber magnatum]
MTSTRRPSLFETRHISRPSLADDIILGPPKMMFASSSTRTPSGKFDHDSQATSLGPPAIDEDRESPRFERFRVGGNIRLGKEMDKDRPERNSLRGDHTKRGFGRDDPEGWPSASRQPRKSFGAEDGDRFRSAGDRGKRETPWDKDRPPKYDNFGREREHRPRGRRDEANWLLEDRGPGNEDKTGDSKTVHSMEEFQRWKERMKASNASEEKKTRVEAPAELIGQDKFPKEPKGSQQSPKETESTRFATEEPATAPAVVENGVDRFFNLWGAPSSSKSPEQDILGNARPETKTAAKSRFTSFFTPQEPVSPNIPEPPIAAKIPTPVNESSSEDKKGFEHILNLLNGTSLGGSEPVSVPSPGISRPPQPSVSPSASMMPSHPPPPLSRQAPITSPPHHRDANAEFLMRLIHQSHQSQQSQPQGPPPPPPLHTPYGGPSQMPPPPPISTSPHNFQRAKNNPLSPAFDDPAITAFRQRSSQESTSPILPRGPPLIEHHGPPGGWNHHQQQQQQQQQQSQPQQPPPPQNHRQVAPPPGFARPQQQHHQGPPPPPAFLGPLPGVNGPQPMPFVLGPPPPNMPPNFGPHPPFFGMNGMNGMNGHPPPPPQMNGPPPQGYHIQFHHPHAEPHGAPMGMHAPPFGFAHDGLKHPQHPHGPGNPRFPNESVHRQLR